MSDDELSETILALEERLLRAETRCAIDQLERLLADEFREIGKSGQVWDKRSVISAMVAEVHRVTCTLEDFRVLLVAPTVALATYRAIDVTGGAEPRQSLRSSVWVLQHGDWRLVFHQGTER